MDGDGINTSWRMRAAFALALVGLGLFAASAIAFDPVTEGKNFSKTSERYQYIVGTPQFQARLQQQNVDDNGELAAITAAEASQGADARNFTGNVCFQHKQECAGDVRFYDWERNGFGISKPVLFGARDGATISGKLWATKAGPANRPAIVLTSGSVQAPEQLYWGIAATLAKHGYIVLTYDVQGQGRSDTFGEAPDTGEGVPSQAGQPFFDGTEDALDFMLSTPSEPYDPRPSCGNANGGTGTDHSAKQDRRVAAGLDSSFNPYWEQVDASRVGIAGHSLGAGAVSYVGQLDPRVDAIVAWDNLRDVSSPPDPNGPPSGAPGCPSGSSRRPATVPLTKPAIGLSNDYGIVATPNGSDPDPQGPNAGYLEYKAAGVDSMQVNTRGGTHFEYAFIPGQTAPPLGLATLRGMDMAVWYSTAWFDRYVKCQGDSACQADADRRLLTDRWRNDAREGQIDAAGDPNLYSFYLRSRFDIHDASGSEQSCEDMRTGCADMTPDGLPAGYSFLADANTIDRAPGSPPGGSGGGGGGAGKSGACSIGQVGTDFVDSPETLAPTDAGDSLRGKGGDDRLRGLRGDDCLYGNAGDDRLIGDGDDDLLRGGSGNDRLRGSGGKDRLTGNAGSDRLKGNGGADKISGGASRDVISPGGGRDRVSGGSGRDRINAQGGGRDRISCGAGRRDIAIVDRRDKVRRDCERVITGAGTS